MEPQSRYAAAYYEAQSPTLLAQQPLEAPHETEPGDNWEAIYSALEGRMQALKNWRWSWWSYWAEVAQYTLPQRYHWLVTPNTYDRGRPVNDAIIDTTAVQAVKVCASGLWSGLTSPSRPWYDIGVAIPWASLDAAALNWLHDTKQRLDVVLEASNFYQTMAQMFADVAVFGTAPVIIYEDDEDVIRCYLPCSGEYCLAVGSRLTVDTIYREFNLTVLDIVQMFGLENCPQKVRRLWRTGAGSLDQEFTVCCAIEPNTVMRGKHDEQIRVVPGGFTYREVHWLKGMKTERELSRRGFWEKPFFAARWSVTSNDPYGRSPGMEVLGDNKQVQLETRRKGEFIEKGVRPPMGAHAMLKNQPSSIQPGGITYVPADAGRDVGFYPLFMPQPAWLSGMTADIQAVQERIKQGFFVDVFMAISQMEGVQPRNELEITKRDLERLQILGPFVNLFETECASPAIMRVLAIMERRRLLLPRPPSLQDVSLKLNYRSIMKIAQEAAETASMERTFAVAGNLSAAAKAAAVPDPIRIMKLDLSLREYGRLTNMASNLFYSDDQVRQMDEQRQQQHAQMQAAAATLPTVQAAKTLSETQVGGGQTALSAMLGGGAPVG